MDALHITIKKKECRRKVAEEKGKGKTDKSKESNEDLSFMNEVGI